MAYSAPSVAVKPIALLFVALFNSMLGLSVLFPILGPLGRELGFSELQVGSFSASYAAMQFLMSTYWGRRSERVGRKPVLLQGILGFGLGFLAFALIVELALRGYLGSTTAFVLLLIARLVGGAFSSATIPTAQAYIADVTERSGRTSGMAVLGAAFGLGVVFGPGIGALLSKFGLVVPVYFSAGCALLNALFVALKLPEPPTRSAAAPLLPLKARDSRISPLLAVGAVLSLSSVAMEQTIAFYFQDRLGLDGSGTASRVGTALVAYGLVAVLVQGGLIRRFSWSPQRLLLLGVPVALAGFVVFIYATGFWGLLLALVLQGFGAGLAAPGVTAALSLAVADNEQGPVAGLNGAAQGFGRMLGPIVGTGLYQLNPVYPYVFSALLLVAVLGWMLFNRRLIAAPASQSAAQP